MFTTAHVLRLADLPPGQQRRVLLRLPVSQRVELIRIAQGMRASGMNGLGKSIFSKIGEFISGAVKTVGNVLTGGILGGSQAAPEVQGPPIPAPAPQTPAWVVPAAIGGGVLLLVLLLRRPAK